MSAITETWASSTDVCGVLLITALNADLLDNDTLVQREKQTIPALEQASALEGLDGSIAVLSAPI